MKVRDVMVPHVFTCSDGATLVDAAKLMWEHDIGFIPVLASDTGKLTGVITDRDICIAAYFTGKPLWDIPIQSSMSMNVVTVSPDAEIDEAEEKMSEKQVHRLAVVDSERKLVGVIGVTDLARRAAAEQDEEAEEEVALTMGAIAHPREARGPTTMP